MKHELASERLLDLAYGELSPRDARDVEAHAAGCEACREELARIRGTRALMAQLPVEPPPERGEGIVFAAAREAAAARGRGARSLLPPWLWAGSIGAVAVAVVAIVSWQVAKGPASDGLRERDGDLMGRSKPMEQAAAPAAAPPATAKDVPAAAAPPEKRKAAPELAVGEAAPRGGGMGLLGGAATSSPPPPAAPPPPRAAEQSREIEREETVRAVGRVALAAPAAPKRAEADRAAPPEPPAPVAQAWAPPPAPSAGAMADAGAPAAEPAAAPRARAAAKEDGRAAAKAEAAAESKKLNSARSSERKAASVAAASPRPRQASGAVEVRSFADCPGERRRVVEYGYDGNVLRYVREGARRTTEQVYGADGQLVSAFAVEGGARRALPLDAPGLVRDARDAGFDAPPRCGQ